MRIIHMLTRLLRAGSEENTVATCLWQAEHGHDVTLIHGPDPDPHWAATYGGKLSFIQIDSLVHPINPLQDVKAVRATRRLFRDLDPDVIHTHQSKAGIIGRAASNVAPAALVVHGIHILPFDGVSAAKRAVYVAAEKYAARHTDLFMAVSRSVGQAYVDAGICDQVEPVYSGMPLARFRNATPPADWPDLLDQPPDAPRRPVVLMLAAFEPRKRHIGFLEAMTKVIPNHPDLRILFAGKGPIEEEVRAAVSRLGLEDHVTFCGHRADPQALIALADLCVLTSEREGLPRVVVQSITAGTPVLVSDLPGIDEILHDGVNGFITDAHDLDDTAQRLSALLSEPAMLAKLAQGAQETDVSNWDLERLGARTTALYKTTIARRHGHAAPTT